MSSRANHLTCPKCGGMDFCLPRDRRAPPQAIQCMRCGKVSEYERLAEAFLQAEEFQTNGRPDESQSG